MKMTAITAQPNSNLTQHPVAQEFRYSTGAHRYIDAQGRFVPAKAVRSAVDTVIEGANQSVQQVAKQLQAGDISLLTWQQQTAQSIKLLHVANGLAGMGGQKMASQADYGYMGSLIKKQYEYLNDFAKDISSGAQKLDGSFLARVKLYSESARGTHVAVEQREMRQSGKAQSRRILGAVDHCPDCLRFAAMGWRPIGELPVIGQDTVCKVNCHCELIYQ
jgi:hypothetical protein